MSDPVIIVRIANTGEWHFQKTCCSICSKDFEPDMIITLEQQISTSEKRLLTQLCMGCGAKIGKQLMDCAAERLLIHGG